MLHSELSDEFNCMYPKLFKCMKGCLELLCLIPTNATFVLGMDIQWNTVEPLYNGHPCVIMRCPYLRPGLPVYFR